MKQELNFDSWLLYSPSLYCNLNCNYCISKDDRNKILPNEIKIELLLKTLENTGRKFLITLTGGGEPFLVPNIINFSKQLTKKHRIAFNTNLTISKVKQFAQEIDPCKVEYIYASTHISELFRTKLIGRFINNFLLLKSKGFNVFTIAIANPSIINHIYKFRKFFQSFNIQLAFDPFFGVYNNKHYPESYTEEELMIFGIPKEKLIKFRSKDMICNAGYNAAVIHNTGYITVCHQIKIVLGHINENIDFNEYLIKCPYKFCGCPLSIEDKLLKQAQLKSPLVGVFY